MCYFLLLEVLENSLPHLVDLFVIYTGTSHPFEFSSLISHLYPTVCLSAFVFSFHYSLRNCLSTTTTIESSWQEKNRKLILITLFDKCAERTNGWQQWNSLFSSPKGTISTHATAKRWRKSFTMDKEYNGIGNDDADFG